MTILIYVVFGLLAFLFGGIPVGYIIVKAKTGQDIRTIGSKNIGATNVGRALGKTWFFIVLFIDAIKGATPVFVSSLLFPVKNSPEHVLLLIIIGSLTILGNLFCPYLHFKGGKGIGTSIGVLVIISPFPFLYSLGVFLIILLLFNYISLGSILGILAFPIFLGFFDYNIYKFIFAVFLFVLITYKHRANIGRLLKGQEHKFIKKK